MPYNQEFSSRLEEEVYKFLLQKGFPPESILYEPAILPIGSNIRYRPDFLIVDPSTGERLALIEVKGPLSNLARASEHLDAYKKALGNLRIATYIITAPEQVPEKLSVLTSEEGINEREVDSEVFPKYEALKANNLADKKADIKNRREDASNSLEIVGTSVAVILVLIVAADFSLSFWKISLLTPERLGLLGAAVAMVVIPYLQKFKGLGIEWEKSNK
ncbi:hypothetical protein WCX72_08795 [Sulfurimonas sp. HSL1-6]|uniref:hypothetical protein n=1 Tax=Thiomicrolovo immobilis TaxID=3131935 RepID=UPI0031F8E48D